MHVLLEKLFKKRGIRSLTDLSNEEKADYDRWQKVLSEGDITLEKIKDFCQSQLETIENEWKNIDNSRQKNERLLIIHTVYKTLKETIEAPAKEREQLIAYLQQLIEES